MIFNNDLNNKIDEVELKEPNDEQLIEIIDLKNIFIVNEFDEETILKSSTQREGLEIVSPNTSLVFSLKAALSSSSVQSGEIKVTSIPIFFMVTERRLKVPP